MSDKPERKADTSSNLKCSSWIVVDHLRLDLDFNSLVRVLLALIINKPTSTRTNKAARTIDEVISSDLFEFPLVALDIFFLL